MKRIKAETLEKVLLLIISLAAMTILSGFDGCGGGGQTPSSPPPGFTIQTVFRSGTALVANSGVTGSACQSNTVGIYPTASIADCIPSNHGAQFFNWGPTGSNGTLFIGNSVFPVSYQFVQNATQNCNTPATTDVDVNNQGQMVPLICSSFPYTTITPSSIAAGSEPATISISGPGINNQYGTPQVLVYNEFGYVVTSTQASIVDASASSLTATTPDFTGLLNGSYAVIVGIYDSSGTLQPTLGTSITISGYYTPPDPGGGGGCTTARCIPGQ